jgi:bla regulator protein BlaR1
MIEARPAVSLRVHRVARSVLVLVLAGCVVVATGAAATNQDAKEPRFEAASVKPNQSGLPGINVSTAGGRFTAMNAPALLLVRLAYAIPENRIVEAPDWLRSERFDIAATTGGVVSRDQQNLMLRALLRERFNLIARHETRDLPIYSLVRPRPGVRSPRLATATADCAALTAAMRAGTPLPPANRILCGSRLRPGGVSVGGMTMAEVAAQVIGPQVDRPVVDRTGLEGSFDFDLDFTPLAPATAATDAPSIFTALDEQLGLRLEPGRGPVDVLVIESVARPAAD